MFTDYDNLNVATFYNTVGLGDVRRLHNDYEGYIKIATIRKITKEIHCDYYICGPGGMMDYIPAELKS